MKISLIFTSTLLIIPTYTHIRYCYDKDMRCSVCFKRGKDWCELPSETNILTTFELCPGNRMAFLLRYSNLSRIGFLYTGSRVEPRDKRSSLFGMSVFLYAKKE